MIKKDTPEFGGKTTNLNITKNKKRDKKMISTRAIRKSFTRRDKPVSSRNIRKSLTIRNKPIKSSKNVRKSLSIREKPKSTTRNIRKSTNTSDKPISSKNIRISIKRNQKPITPSRNLSQSFQKNESNSKNNSISIKMKKEFKKKHFFASTRKPIKSKTSKKNKFNPRSSRSIIKPKLRKKFQSKRNRSKSKKKEEIKDDVSFISKSDMFDVKVNEIILKKEKGRVKNIKNEYMEFNYKVQYMIFTSLVKDENKINKENRIYEKLPPSEIPYYPKLEYSKNNYTLKDTKRWTEHLNQFYHGKKNIILSPESMKTKRYFLKQVKKNFDDPNFKSSLFLYMGPFSITGKIIMYSKDTSKEEISFKEIYELWKNRISKQEFLFFILDCNYSGKWKNYLEKINDPSVAIQVSSHDNQKSKVNEFGGVFTHNCMKYLKRFMLQKILMPKEQDPQFFGNYLYLKKFTNLFFKFKSWKEMEYTFKSAYMKFVMNNGFFLGYIRDGMKNSWGMLKFISDDLRYLCYNGEFHNNKFQGQGLLRLNNGKIFEGTFKKNAVHGFAKEIFVDGDIYEGNFVRGIKEGKGFYQYNNGDLYKGDFIDNLPHGKGLLKLNNGNVYKGQFKEGKIQGNGHIFYYNGDSYNGEWKDSLKHGEGIYSYSKGHVYEGNFVKGRMDGFGIMIRNDGSKYEGEWKEGYKNGSGVFWHKNGDKIEGEWKGGNQVKKIMFFKNVGSERIVMRK